MWSRFKSCYSTKSLDNGKVCRPELVFFLSLSFPGGEKRNVWEKKREKWGKNTRVEEAVPFKWWEIRKERFKTDIARYVWRPESNEGWFLFVVFLLVALFANSDGCHITHRTQTSPWHPKLYTHILHLYPPKKITWYFRQEHLSKLSWIAISHLGRCHTFCEKT